MEEGIKPLSPPAPKTPEPNKTKNTAPQKLQSGVVSKSNNSNKEWNKALSLYNGKSPSVAKTNTNEVQKIPESKFNTKLIKDKSIDSDMSFERQEMLGNGPKLQPNKPAKLQSPTYTNWYGHSVNADVLNKNPEWVKAAMAKNGKNYGPEPSKLNTGKLLSKNLGLQNDNPILSLFSFNKEKANKLSKSYVKRNKADYNKNYKDFVNGKLNNEHTAKLNKLNQEERMKFFNSLPRHYQAMLLNGESNTNDLEKSKFNYLMNKYNGKIADYYQNVMMNNLSEAQRKKLSESMSKYDTDRANKLFGVYDDLQSMKAQDKIAKEKKIWNENARKRMSDKDYQRTYNYLVQNNPDAAEYIKSLPQDYKTYLTMIVNYGYTANDIFGNNSAAGHSWNKAISKIINDKKLMYR